MHRHTIIILFLIVISCMNSAGQNRNLEYQYALIEAVKQKNLGNIAGAIELYKMVIEENDSVAVAHYELGTLYLAVNEPELAREHFRKAYQADRENEWFANAYVDVLVILEKYQEAEHLLNEIDNGTIAHLDKAYKKANIYFLWGKSRKAIRILKRIEEEYGISDKVILLKANIYEEDEKYKAARKEIEKLIANFPEAQEFLVVAAELALKNRKEELASKYYSQVLELDSTNIYALTNLTDYYRGTNQHKKSLYYLKKSFESDLIDYERKMAILSYYLTDDFFLNNYSTELSELIQVVLEKYKGKEEIIHFAVDFFIRQRDYRNAFDSLSPLLVKDMKNYEVWKQGILLANALSERKKLLELSSNATELFPDSSEMIYFRGIAEYENELYDEVVGTFSHPAFVSTTDQELRSQTRQILAESYYRLGEYHKSDSLFRKIIKEEPDNYLVINNFSYYLALRNDSLDEARSLSYRTIQDNPESSTFLDTYAWILYKLGEYREAEKYINKALQKGGLNDPDINEHAAEIHIKLKSYHVARSFFEKAIILGGDKARLENRIAELDLYE